MCLSVTVLIGVCIPLLSLNSVEDVIISELQNLTQRTIGIPFFMVFTYLGDFTLWIAFSGTLFIYAFFKSRKHFRTSVQLIFYLALVTVSTYLLKEVFTRPRPDSAGITIYSEETFFGIPLQGRLLADLSSFSYPSGHVSRATGSLLVFSGKRSTTKTALIAVAIAVLSLSRIVLGLHYPTDVIGAIPLSLAMVEVTRIMIARAHLSSLI